ncbi:DJ-1/PfpI family protein (plasmid) [Cupriavidus sp. KK10]|uniref:DJ-1/PfpI family protein n=1 Tax=Cupriavidus sp. KK10 TaxID=1478019 RepID=UPI001BA9B339|nr:DJ-1/PfpI family protein [Cupriavidus sp. KK10]QUN32553.1 DJ-1/PfpI family protein [Cupriavidus sp. KK10]
MRKIIAAGFTPVFANPKGNAVTFDPVSNDKVFFGGSDAVRAENVQFVEGVKDLRHPKTLAEIAKEGTSDYVGIFIPGGHAPMEDLSHDKTLGGILASFHAAGKPTSVICHGPTALLSAVSDPEAFRKAIIANDFTATQKIAATWPYTGYRLTVFVRRGARDRGGRAAARRLGAVLCSGCSGPGWRTCRPARHLECQRSGGSRAG